MSDLIGKHAIVVGAGMGGLAFAKALMSRFLIATLCPQMSGRATARRRPVIFMCCLRVG